MSLIIYTHPSNSLAVASPEADDINDCLSKLLARGMSDAQIVEESAIPTDKTYRDAWELVDGIVYINQVKKDELKAAWAAL